MKTLGKMKNHWKSQVMVFILVTIISAPFLQAKDLPTINWRFQSAYPPGDYNADIYAKNFIDYVKKHTNGKFKITRYYAGEIMPATEMLTGIGQGLVEIGEGAAFYWTGIEKALDLSFGLPGTNRAPIGDVWAFQNASPWSEMVTEIMADHGVQYIAWHDYGPYPMFCSNVPIRKLSDWKGVKVRIAGYGAKLMNAMGASTTYIPGAEIAQALSMGTIDVGTWTAEAIKDMGFGSVMDYLILPPFVDHAGGVLIANKKAWEKLPVEYQKVIRDAELEQHYKSFNYWNKYFFDNINLAEGVGKGPRGYEVVRLPDEDVSKMNQLAEKVVWEEWAKESPRCAAAVEILREWYSTYRQ